MLKTWPQERKYLEGTLKWLMAKTDLTRELDQGLLKVVFDMATKAIANYYYGGAVCGSLPGGEDHCTELETTATTFQIVIDKLLGLRLRFFALHFAYATLF